MAHHRVPPASRTVAAALTRAVALALALALGLGGCARETTLDWAGRVAQGAISGRCAFDDHCVTEREIDRYRLHRRDEAGG